MTIVFECMGEGSSGDSKIISSEKNIQVNRRSFLPHFSLTLIVIPNSSTKKN
jgi:hypothetical protein